MDANIAVYALAAALFAIWFWWHWRADRKKGDLHQLTIHDFLAHNASHHITRSELLDELTHVWKDARERLRQDYWISEAEFCVASHLWDLNRMTDDRAGEKVLMEFLNRITGHPNHPRPFTEIAEFVRWHENHLTRGGIASRRYRNFSSAKIRERLTQSKIAT